MKPNSLQANIRRVYNQCGLRAWVAALLLGVFRLAAMDSPADADLKPGEANVRFRWALGAATATNTSLVSITQKATLKTRDRIEVLVEPLEDCFVYVIAEDMAAGSFVQWYPERDAGPRTPTPGRKLEIELDEKPGRERLHVLGSATRLVELEAMIAEYQRAPAEARPRLAAAITAMLKSLREKSLSKPSRISDLLVKYRTSNPTIESLVTEISAKDLVVRSILLDYR